MLGCVLPDLGYEATEVAGFLDAVHKLRGKPGWPEADGQRKERFHHWNLYRPDDTKRAE